MAPKPIPLNEDEVVAAYLEKLSLRDVAASFNVSRTPIARILKAKGITMDNSPRGPKENRAKCGNRSDNRPKLPLSTSEVVEAYRKQPSIREVAKKFGASGHAIHSRLHKAGVELRPVGRPKSAEKRK